MVHQFWHETPLRRGVTYELGFIVRNPDMAEDPYWLTEESLAFHEPTRHAVFEVQFKGTVPEQIWAFSGLTAAERPGAPNAGMPLAAATGLVRVQFRDLYGGLYAGVAWGDDAEDRNGWEPPARVQNHKPDVVARHTQPTLG